MCTLIKAIDHCAPALLERRLRSGVYRFSELNELEKSCSTCRDYWPADSEFFYTGCRYDDRLHCIRKACYIERRRPERHGTPHHQAH